MDKIILIAYDLNPELGSECGTGHSYLQMYLKHFIVKVFTNEAHRNDIQKFNYGDNVTFNFIRFNYFEKTLARIKLDVISNWFFCKKACDILLSDSNLHEFKFMHIVTPEGFFAYNNLHKLGINYIIGPINGGLKTPEHFRKVFNKNIITDFLRDSLYKSVIKLPGWNKYYNRAEKIIISDKNLLKSIPGKYHNKTFQIFDVLVDPVEFSPGIVQSDASTTTILFTGRLIPKKGILLLLKAYLKCLVDFKIDNLKLSIVGNGPLLKNVLSFIENNYLQDKISVYNNISRNTLIEKYQTSDIFCLPTLREPGGLAILEAMSCGLPIITSNYGGPSYSVTNECGIKIEMGNYDQYIDDTASAIARLYYEPVLRRKMGVASRERIIEEFSTDSVERKLINLWESFYK